MKIKIRCPILLVPSNPLRPTPMGFHYTLFHQLSRESVRDGYSCLCKTGKTLAHDTLQECVQLIREN
jgi:hypothetical protein